MRDFEAWCGNDAIAVEDEIDIERAGRAERTAFAAAFLLERLQFGHQRLGSERSLPHHHGVEIWRLVVGDIKGCRLDNRRNAEGSEKNTEPADCELEIRPAVTEIGAERDDDVHG